MAWKHVFCRLRLLATVATISVVSIDVHAQAHAAAQQIDIRPGDLATALKTLGAATQSALIFDPALVRGRSTAGARGYLTRDEALRLILANSGLRYSISSSGAVMISAPQAATTGTPKVRTVSRDDAPAISEAAVQSDPSPQEGEIVVTGARESFRSALSTKRMTAEIVDSIAAQDIGKLPDPNLADTLSRVPGVQLYRFAGEGVYASIRGLVDQNRTEYNGRSVYTPDSAVGGGRDFQPDNAMPELVSGIDIFKNPSAERIEGAIGGLVNIKTYKPFDFKGLTAIASAKMSYYDLADKAKPALFGLVSDRWTTPIGEIGVLLAATYSKTAVRQDAVTSNGNNYTARPYLTYGVDRNGNGVTNTAAAPNADRADQVLAPNGFGQQMLYGGRERKAFEGSIAWKPSSRLRLNFDASHIEYLYDENNAIVSTNLAAAGLPFSNLEIRPSTTVVGTPDVAGGSTLPLGTTLAGYDFRRATFSGASFQQLRNSFTDEMKQTLLALGGSWDAAERLKVSGELGYTRSRQVKTTRAMNLVTSPSRLYTVTQDLSGKYQSLTVDGGVAPLADPANWSYDSYGKQYNPITVEEKSARLDLTRDFANGPVTAIKVGARATDLDYVFDRGATNWTIRDANGTSSANLVSLASTGDLVDHLFGDLMRGKAQGITGFASFADPFLDGNDARLAAALPTAYRIVNGVRVNGIAPGDPALDPSLHFEVGEQTYAGYGVADYAFEVAGVPIDGNVGVRVVRTEGTTRGFQSQPLSYGYTNALPSLNLRAEVMRDVYIRIGLSKGLTRPGFKNLNPSITTITTGLAPGTIPLVTIGNPRLGPQKSRNYDLSLEYYFSRTGYAYLSGFHKSITGFVTNFQQFEDLGFRDTAGNAIIPLVTRPINGAGGRVTGFEAGIQTFLETLPSPWDGVGIQANYTFVDSSQDVPLGSAAAPSFVKVPLAYLSKNSFNAVLMYEKSGLSARVAYGYRSKYSRFQFGGGLPNVPVTTPPFGTLDFSLNYDLRPGLTLTAEATNLTDSAPDRFADGRDDRPAVQYTYDRRFAVGLRYRFGG